MRYFWMRWGFLAGFALAGAGVGVGCSASGGASGGTGGAAGAAGSSGDAGPNACSEEGATEACVTANDYGSCAGQRTCTGGEWGACDAAVPVREDCNGQDDNCNGETDEATILGSPACSPSGSTCAGRLVCQGSAGLVCEALAATPEVCNLVDDDCNGAVDEDFRDTDGLYIDPNHCGACDVVCAAVFPQALTTECQVIAGNPRCVVTDCPPGSSVAPGGFGCVTIETRLCEPCTADTDCSLTVGERCVDYGGGEAFCGRDCSPGSVFGETCPTGFTCDAGQCRVASGSCACNPGDSFEKPCDYPSTAQPGAVCAGTQTCAGGTLSACAVPGELCNGLDDDCNGVVDDGFTDPVTGQYTDAANCGACGIDCTGLFGSPIFHAQGDCSAAVGEVPACVPRCTSGYADANRVSSDGCECAIQDPNLDLPDLNNVDANCDGMDGQVSRGIFVSTLGVDTNPGTRERPVRHVQRGVALAAAAGSGRDHVYVAEGVYEESVTLANGVSVYGGYSTDFTRHDPLSWTTIVIGGTPTAAVKGALNGVGITQPTVVDGLLVRASSSATPAGNSYAVYLRDSGSALTLTHSRVVAGQGSPGGVGSAGGAGSSPTQSGAAGNGAKTGSAQQCGNDTVAGGGGAAFTCGGTSTAGGNGGSSDCPVYDQAEPAGQAGQTSGGVGGVGGYNSLLYRSGGSCVVVVPNAAGATQVGLPGVSGGDGGDGSAAAACVAGRGSVSSIGEWVNAVGGTGGTGIPGKGGGGGGAGGGVEINSLSGSCATGVREALGASGGGGGGGGCGGLGGASGGGGGGSFAVFVHFSSAPTSLPVIVDCTIDRGFGGNGGGGGLGGTGGLGSLGGAGGTVTSSGGTQNTLVAFSSEGGRGGDGGNGGFGGGGAGGCGGGAYGIYLSNAGALSTAPLLAGNTFTAVGGPGAGGAGGPSLGISGPSGPVGQFVEVSP